MSANFNILHTCTTPITGVFADLAFARDKALSKFTTKTREQFYERLQNSIISIYCKGDNQRLLRRGLVKLHRLFYSCRKDASAFTAMATNECYREMILDQFKKNPDRLNRYLLLKLQHSRFEDYQKAAKLHSSMPANEILGNLTIHLGATAFAISNIGVVLGFTASSALALDNLINGDFEIKATLPASKKERYKIIYICGIDNRDPYFTEQLESLSHFLPEANVSGVFNKSHGLTLDLLEVATHRYAPKVSSMRSIVSAATRQIKSALADGKPVIVIGHSAGASVARDSWINLTKQERLRVGIVMVSPITDTPTKGSPTQVVIYNYNQENPDPISSMPFTTYSTIVGTHLEDVEAYSDISKHPGHLFRSYIRNDPSRSVQTEVRRIAKEILNSNN